MKRCCFSSPGTARHPAWLRAWRPPMAPEGDAEVDCAEHDKEALPEEWVDVEIEANESEMVEGWWDADMAPTLEPEPNQDNDACSYMQVAARVGPTTIFASYLARLQARFESMTKPQRENIVDLLHKKLDAWRQEWVMSLTSISRDRADRLWALLVTYQGEATCIQPNDAEWAEARWAEVVAMLQIDAVRPAEIGAFRMPRQMGAVVVEDTQQDKQEKASSSEDVMVRRTPRGEWERATESEKAELARHDADTKAEEERQAAHDEQMWSANEASRAREWDEWALRTEMENSTKSRPLKKFKVRVTVTDADHNELATANLTGEVETDDTPQVSITVQEEIVQAPCNENQKEQDQQQPEGKRAEGEDNIGIENGEGEADQSETVVATSREEEDDIDAAINADITDLGDIMESVMGRQWFQLYVDRQVDAEMVRKRWGAAALEVFQVNRDMMELMEAVQKDKGKSAAERLGTGSPDALEVRNMDEEDDSNQSSGAKVFPRREVAGRRGMDDAESKRPWREKAARRAVAMRSMQRARGSTRRIRMQSSRAVTAIKMQNELGSAAR